MIRAKRAHYLLLLAALALVAAVPARGTAQQPTLSQAVGPSFQADDEDDDSAAPAPPRAEAPAETNNPSQGNVHGAIRRVDPYDDDETAPDNRPPHPAVLANPGHDIVICEAGCDGPGGQVVYKKKREASSSVR